MAFDGLKRLPQTSRSERRLMSACCCSQIYKVISMRPNFQEMQYFLLKKGDQSALAAHRQNLLPVQKYSDLMLAITNMLNYSSLNSKLADQQRRDIFCHKCCQSQNSKLYTTVKAYILLRLLHFG